MKKKWIATIAMLLCVILAGCAAAYGPESPAAQTPITSKEAENIALDHAGVMQEFVSDSLSYYELDDGVPEYEVEFRQGDYEYSYTIHAETGTVQDWSKEYEPALPQPEESAPPVLPTESTTEPAEKLTAKKAEDIALKHAGLKRENVRFERTELDTDDRVPAYEIEFHADGWEYDYEIHAETGKVLSSDKEKEKSSAPAATEPAPTEPAQKLAAKEAEDIALKHAGLKRENVRFERTELDADDRVPVYEIEFHADGWEYDYEIHAETGKILSSEKDRDD